MKINVNLITAMSMMLLLIGCGKSEKISTVQGEWKSGFGQGTVEYFVDNGPGNQVYIACPSNAPANISATILGKDPDAKKGEKITFIIDSVEYQNEFLNNDCRVCTENFIFFWDKLRNAKTLSVKFSDSIRSEFSVSGINTVIPPLDKSQCLVNN